MDRGPACEYRWGFECAVKGVMLMLSGKGVMERLVEYDVKVLRSMVAKGGHLVLCERDKVPSMKPQHNRGQWRDYRPDYNDVHFHIVGSGLVGLIPASLGLCCIDIDEGSYDGIMKYCEGYGVPHRLVKTKGKGGYHVWVRTERGFKRDNYKWSAKSASGDIRSGNGYAILWDAAVVWDLYLDLDDHPGVGDEFFKAFVPVSGTGDWEKGNRNNTLSRAVFSCLLNDRPYSEEVERARREGLSDKEIESTVNSAKKKVALLKDRTFDRRDKEVLGLCLERMGIEYRYDIRSLKAQLSIKGAGWVDKTDRLAAKVRSRIAEEFLLRTKTVGTQPLEYSQAKFDEYFNALLYDFEVDPFLIWLESLDVWDEAGEDPRVNYLLSSLFGSESSSLVHWASRYPLVGAIQRAYEPGCKLDEIPVYVGEQGLGKSHYLSELLPSDGRWFGDALNFISPSKDRVEALQGKVIVEASEMAGSTRAEVNMMKAFISRVDDGSVRLAYRRDPEYSPRRCVIVGTTNSDESLPNDMTGNRRFVPVVLEKGLDVESTIPEIRERLWAEALHLYRRGVRANLPRDLHGEARAAAEEHRYKTSTEEVIRSREWPDKFYAMEEVVDELGKDWSLKRDSRSIGNVLRIMGWKYKRQLVGGRYRRVWFPPEE